MNWRDEKAQVKIEQTIEGNWKRFEAQIQSTQKSASSVRHTNETATPLSNRVHFGTWHQTAFEKIVSWRPSSITIHQQILFSARHENRRAHDASRSRFHDGGRLAASENSRKVTMGQRKATSAQKARPSPRTRRLKDQPCTTSASSLSRSLHESTSIFRQGR